MVDRLEFLWVMWLLNRVDRMVWILFKCYWTFRLVPCTVLYLPPWDRTFWETAAAFWAHGSFLHFGLNDAFLWLLRYTLTFIFVRKIHIRVQSHQIVLVLLKVSWRWTNLARANLRLKRLSCLFERRKWLFLFFHRAKSWLQKWFRPARTPRLQIARWLYRDVLGRASFFFLDYTLGALNEELIWLSKGFHLSRLTMRFLQSLVLILQLGWWL